MAGGYKAIDSLRLEKGYRVWGADITPEDTPYEAGLGFAVKPDKGPFVGREALAAAAEPERRLRCLVLAEPRAVALGSEPVRVGEALVGRVTSGGYGYTVDASVAFAYLPAEHDVGTEVAVEIFGDWVPGVVADEPLFDPDGERIRALSHASRRPSRACGPTARRRSRRSVAGSRTTTSRSRVPTGASCCGSRGARRTCSGSTAGWSARRRRPPPGGGRPGGGRVRRARGAGRDALHRGRRPSARLPERLREPAPK